MAWREYLYRLARATIRISKLPYMATYFILRLGIAVYLNKFISEQVKLYQRQTMS